MSKKYLNSKDEIILTTENKFETILNLYFSKWVETVAKLF